MTNTTSKKTVSTTLSINELAKARDGLIANGVSPTQLRQFSSLLRYTFYFGLTAICADPAAPATEDSIRQIKQHFQKTKVKNISLNDIINVGE